MLVGKEEVLSVTLLVIGRTLFRMTEEQVAAVQGTKEREAIVGASRGTLCLPFPKDENVNLFAAIKSLPIKK